MVVEPYAAGLSCLVEDEKDLGVTLVDMGGGTTTIAVFYDGQVVFADSIPVGGGHVTNDVGRGLSTPVIHAERMKILYGSAIPSQSDENEIIDVPLVGEDDHNHPNHVPRSILTGIIRPRIEETFELVRERLELSGADRVSGRRLVLTGGASQLHGVPELAGQVMEKAGSGSAARCASAGWRKPPAVPRFQPVPDCCATAWRNTPESSKTLPRTKTPRPAGSPGSASGLRESF